MEHYDVNYGILNYSKFYDRLRNLSLNGENSVSIYREDPIGKTRCGFNIEHYRVGDGPVHIVFAAGENGSEIIGVDYIITLMENLAKGNGVFKDFDPNIYTIDFLPCLNPEGYFTTTYAISDTLKDKNDEEIEKFSFMYSMAYLKDDENIMVVNKCILEVVKNANMNVEKATKLSDLFWRMYKGKEIKYDDIVNFLSINVSIDNIEDIVLDVLKKWHFDSEFTISEKKWHYRLFKNLNIDCIPEIDERHVMLKNNLLELYRGNKLYESLIGFNANSVGVDLSKNNEVNYNSMKAKRSCQGEIYGYGRDNDILISDPSALGAPNYDMDSDFKLEPENMAIINFISSLSGENNLFMFCGGTGNSLYIYPYALDELVNKDEKTKQIMFYTNNKLASTFANELGEAREDLMGTNKLCTISAYNDDVNGVKDLIRRNFNTTMLLQLSLGTGNPLGAYKDKKMYEANMIANMVACKKLMGSLVRLDRLNDVSKGFTM